MAVNSPQFDRRHGISGGSDVWDDGLAGALLSADYFQVSTGSSSWTILPTGGLSFVGTVSITLQKNVVITPSGNVILSGTAPIVFGNGANSVTYLPTGSVVFSGTSTISKGRVFFSSGTITFSSGTLVIHSRTVYPTGSLSFVGSAVALRGKVYIPQGIIQFSGTAPMSSNTTVETLSTKLTLTFAGKT